MCMGVEIKEEGMKNKRGDAVNKSLCGPQCCTDWEPLMYSNILRWLDPITVCICDFPTLISNFWTPSVYLTVQLNSDTIYLEIVSDSTG